VRYLVISDIHANFTALEAVLADAPDFDKVWCLGDLVGYGPNPNECVSRVQELPHVSLAGNHDWAALGQLDLSSFNIDARRASTWTQSELTPDTRGYLSELPIQLTHEGFHLVHASPREPLWEYILDAHMAYANFAHFSTPVCLVGHTHIPLAFAMDEQRQRCKTLIPPFDEPIELEGRRMILNPGSVGQPRDGNPEASYALLDTDAMTWAFNRVSYPVEIVQERMRARDLPRRLINRLELGR
jgi:diadenosine tetraphosphatase ApaH/serine/threonine PP2A family protein phosphatase